jgi:hypothetical protein
VPVIGEYPNWKCANCGRVVGSEYDKLKVAIHGLQAVAAADSLNEARTIAEFALEELGV